MMSGWATTYTWRCDPIDTSDSPQALRVSSPSSTITIEEWTVIAYCFGLKIQFVKMHMLLK